MKALSIILVAMVALVAQTSAQADPAIDLEKTTPPTESLDYLMNLLITKGFAKEKEDNIDLKCGCDCTCCQARKSQYWIDEKGANTAAREYVSKYLHLSGQALENHMAVHFPEKWLQFDVLKTGQIEIEQMSSFLKQVMGDMTIPI